MATTNVEKIKDAEMRETMASAHKALKEGDFLGVVARAGGGCLELLKRKPEMLHGQQQFMNVVFFPRLGAHLIVNHDGQPEIVWDREKFSFSEAVTYFEFTIDRPLKAGL